MSWMQADAPRCAERDDDLTLVIRPLGGHTMGVVAEGRHPPLHAISDARVVLAGGAAPGERHIWWNFVSSSEQRIEQAKQQWRSGGFPPVPADDEFIPLPED